MKEIGRTDHTNRVEERAPERDRLERRAWLAPALLEAVLRARLVRDEARARVLLLDVPERLLRPAQRISEEVLEVLRVRTHAPQGRRSCPGCGTSWICAAVACAPRSCASSIVPTKSPATVLLRQTPEERGTHNRPRTNHEEVRGPDDDRIDIIDERAVGRVADSLGKEEGAGDGDKERGYEHDEDIAELRDGCPQEQTGEHDMMLVGGRGLVLGASLASGAARD